MLFEQLTLAEMSIICESNKNEKRAKVDTAGTEFVRRMVQIVPGTMQGFVTT
jgi:hypothetical protein